MGFYNTPNILPTVTFVSDEPFTKSRAMQSAKYNFVPDAWKRNALTHRLLPLFATPTTVPIISLSYSADSELSALPKMPISPVAMVCMANRL